MDPTSKKPTLPSVPPVNQNKDEDERKRSHTGSFGQPDRNVSNPPTSSEKKARPSSGSLLSFSADEEDLDSDSEKLSPTFPKKTTERKIGANTTAVENAKKAAADKEAKQSNSTQSSLSQTTDIDLFKEAHEELKAKLDAIPSPIKEVEAPPPPPSAPKPKIDKQRVKAEILDSIAKSKPKPKSLELKDPNNVEKENPEAEKEDKGLKAKNLEGREVEDSEIIASANEGVIAVGTADFGVAMRIGIEKWVGPNYNLDQDGYALIKGLHQFRLPQHKTSGTHAAGEIQVNFDQRENVHEPFPHRAGSHLTINEASIPPYCKSWLLNPGNKLEID